MLVYALFLFLTGTATASDYINQSGERELRKKILSHYNKTLPPNMDEATTDVIIRIIPYRLNNFDEQTSSLKYEAYLHMRWDDPRLSWADDPNFNETLRLSFTSDALWKPKLNIFNCGRAVRYGKTDLPLECFSRGVVWYVVAAELHPVCVPDDNRWFPLDTHTCSLALGAPYPQSLAWAALELTETSLSFSIYRGLEIENPHWELLSLTPSRENTPESTDEFYSSDLFTFKIERKRRLLLLAFLPSMLNCIVISWTSLVLPASGDTLTRRLGLIIFAFILQSVLLSSMIRTLPGVQNKTPVIVRTNGLCVVLVFLMLLHTLVLSRFIRKSSADYFYRMCRKLPGPLQLILGNDQQLVDEELVDSDDTNEHPIREGREQFRKIPDNLNHGSSQLVMNRVCDRIHFILQIVLFAFGLMAVTIA